MSGKALAGTASGSAASAAFTDPLPALENQRAFPAVRVFDPWGSPGAIPALEPTGSGSALWGDQIPAPQRGPGAAWEQGAGPVPSPQPLGQDQCLATTPRPHPRAGGAAAAPCILCTCYHPPALKPLITRAKLAFLGKPVLFSSLLLMQQLRPMLSGRGAGWREERAAGNGKAACGHGRPSCAPVSPLQPSPVSLLPVQWTRCVPPGSAGRVGDGSHVLGSAAALLSPPRHREPRPTAQQQLLEGKRKGCGVKGIRNVLTGCGNCTSYSSSDVSHSTARTGVCRCGCQLCEE